MFKFAIGVIVGIILAFQIDTVKVKVRGFVNDVNREFTELQK